MLHILLFDIAPFSRALHKYFRPRNIKTSLIGGHISKLIFLHTYYVNIDNWLRSLINQSRIDFLDFSPYSKK